ncbi:MAG: ribosome maturation factor RimP, partial [Bdellovibrionales bacterium]|nr:ribosome maturation factor RimP [Bdellovibrionales bacterium]
MLSPQATEKLKLLADEVSRREGCLLYDLEFSGNPKNRVLRVFIEAEKETVSIEQCANVSRGLSLLLDVEDLIPGGNYELEVSSPGIERPLRLPWHFQKAIGQEVKLVTFDPIEGLKGEVKSFTTELVGADDEVAQFKYQEDLVRVPY